jgi:hypothetical protein
LFLKFRFRKAGARQPAAGEQAAATGKSSMKGSEE